MHNYKLVCSLVVLLIHGLLFSQENKTCNTSIDDLIDLNSISVSKCSVEKNEPSKDNTSDKNIKVQVTSRRRIVRKKEAHSILDNEQKAELTDIKSDNSIKNVLTYKRNFSQKFLFSHVEISPLFKDCERKPSKQQKKCFHNNMFDHVNSNLKYPKNSYNKGIQGKVLLQFVIDKNGNVKDVSTKGPYLGDELVKESKRIINLLPQLKPAKHQGEAVDVIYAIPITFNIPGRDATNENITTTVNGKIYDFEKLDTLPYFSSCKDKSESCFNSKLIKHINKYFHYPIDALNNNIQGKVAAYFTIDSRGNVADIKAIGPENGTSLEKATIKLFSKLPKLNPGRLNGWNVNSKYTFPVDYNLN